MPKFLSQKAFCIKKYIKICTTEAQKSSNEPSNRSVKKKTKTTFQQYVLRMILSFSTRTQSSLRELILSVITGFFGKVNNK